MMDASSEHKMHNEDVIRRRMHRLRSDEETSAWLKKLGLKDATLNALRVGITDQAKRGKSRTFERALSLPHRPMSDSSRKYIYLSINGLTFGAPSKVWSTGESETFYAEDDAGQSTVIACDMHDLLAVKQLITRAPDRANVQIVASTSVELPLEWSSPAFWDQWDRVLVAPSCIITDLPLLVLRGASRPVLEVVPRSTSTWFDSLSFERAESEFSTALRSTSDIAEDMTKNCDGAIGRFAYDPVDVGRAFHNGNLYYPVRTLLQEMHVDKVGKPIEVQSIQNVVVRSDGKVLTAKEMPAKPGTPVEQRVWRLTDGTLIDEAPAPSRHSSWSWRSIEELMEARKKGAKIGRDLPSLLAELECALEEAVWLPNHEDYTMLGLVVAASYVQPVFKAVPYVLVCGEKGTGKSQLGIALSQLGCNGNIIGQVSAATAARTMHEGRGLTVFDDLEGIGPGKRGNDGSFTEFVQWLKVSYNADTAKKPWTDSSAGFKVRVLNGFGIKVINNTLGTDSILGSRMIRIGTQRMPEEIGAERRRRPPNHRNLAQLRDQLHVWAFENVHEVDHCYRQQVAPSKRDEEIAAPLRVLASLAGDDGIETRLESSLSASTKIATIENDSPQDIVREAVTNLVKRGQYDVSASLVSMEARRLVGPNFGKSHKAELTEIDDGKVVGRYLLSMGLVEREQTRVRVHRVQMRFARVKEHILREVFEDRTRPVDVGPQGFCGNCEACPYVAQSCEIRSRRKPN